MHKLFKGIQMDNLIEKYKHTGLLSVWRFPNSKNFKGLNITFDDTARNSLIELIQLMLDSQWTSKKSISSKAPMDLDQKWIIKVGKTKLYNKLSIIVSSQNANSFDIQENGDTAILNFDKTGLNEFKNKLINNSFDEGLETSNKLDCIYFW